MILSLVVEKGRGAPVLFASLECWGFFNISLIKLLFSKSMAVVSSTHPLYFIALKLHSHRKPGVTQSTRWGT